MTQASMLHVQGNRVNIDRVSKALQLLQSTSPSYLLLASLDAARQQMALQGKELMTITLQLADDARNRISQIPGLSVLQLVETPGFVTLDKTRLTVTVSGLGLTGFEADEILHQELGVTAELPSLQHLTFIITLGNTASDIERLVQAFITLARMKAEGAEEADGSEEEKLLTSIHSPLATRHSPLATRHFILHPSLSPREAFFAPTETLPIEQTSDRISAELVCPYPPGIPVLIPGEVITPEALDYLQKIKIMGGYISGCADPNLNQLKVVKT